jgi:haloalkane dehalogenase
MSALTPPPENARPAWLPGQLYPFQSHAELDRATLHYVDEGSGPPLLLLHGNPTWSFLYREIIKGTPGRGRRPTPSPRSSPESSAVRPADT